ncbi:ABC transporter permease [Muricoccus radiodurans]|uniref:ABC transporter permease n=1 Tax=Muricoccus radiodurans TaxID=2231721 RepID=UPI003CF96143
MRLARANLYIGAALVALIVGAGLLGLFWTPYDPLGVSIRARFLPPGAAHWLGTDEFGRDVLSRLLAASAVSLRVSVITVAFAVAAGTVIGLAAGFFRGWVDRLLMMVNDALLAFPGTLLALGLVAVLGANEDGIILALGIAYAPSVARVVRGSVLGLREREFVEASRVLGNGEWFTLLRHVLPNCAAPIIVLATSMLGLVMLSESALSFLGLGVPPPAATWGNMLAAARPNLGTASWLGIFPGLAIAAALLGFNLLGDALRDWLDPRMAGGTS